MDMKATVEQFRRYLSIQFDGNWNMFSREALDASNLNEDVYFDIIENYETYITADGYASVYNDLKEFYDEISDAVEDNYYETHCYSY